jgi:hypothetical protein
MKLLNLLRLPNGGTLDLDNDFDFTLCAGRYVLKSMRVVKLIYSSVLTSVIPYLLTDLGLGVTFYGTDQFRCNRCLIVRRGFYTF